MVGGLNQEISSNLFGSIVDFEGQKKKKKPLVRPPEAVNVPRDPLPPRFRPGTIRHRGPFPNTLCIMRGDAIFLIVRRLDEIFLGSRNNLGRSLALSFSLFFLPMRRSAVVNEAN